MFFKCIIVNTRSSKYFSRYLSALPLEKNDIDLKRFADFKKYLKNNKISYKDGITCFHIECRLCKQRALKLPVTAYMNKRTGVILCPECDVKKTLTDVVNIYEKESLRMDCKSVKLPYYISKNKNVSKLTIEICDNLNIKGLQVKDIEAIGGTYDNFNKNLHIPLKNANNKIVGEKILSLTDKNEETYQNINCSGILMKNPSCGLKSKAILVNNVIDFLVLSTEHLESHCIVCLPYSLKSLPQECLPTLEVFEEIIFWFNFDSVGWDTALTISNKMDEKRCLLIRPTDNEPSPHKAQQKGLNIRNIIQKAMPVRHKSITTFSSLRNDILSHLQNVEKVNGVKWKRFPTLNKLLKGHRMGELTILTGPTGSGKTTFMSEYSLDLALQGVSTLWGSFEIRNSRLAGTLLRQFVGYSLENKLDEFNYWSDELEKYPIYFMTFHGPQPLKVVMDAIEHAQYVYDIQHVIIDNLQFMMGISASYRTDKFWEQDAIISSFRTFATKYNVHVTLVMHPRKERDVDELTVSSVFGTAKATQEADNVLIIQDKRLTSVRGKKYLQIVKNRYSGDLGIMPLEFNKDSLSYARAKSKNC